MKKVLFLLFFIPSASFGFQTEVSGSFNTVELDATSSITGYQATINYYYDEIYYDSKPFKEAAFISRESSLRIGLGSSEFDDSVDTTSGSSYELSGTKYSDDFYLFGGIVSSSSEDTEIRSYSISPGLFMSKKSLVFVQYDYIDVIDTTVLGNTVSFGLKSVFKKANLKLIASRVHMEDDVDEYNARQNTILFEHYLSNTTFIGLSYETLKGDSSDLDDVKAAGLHFGGLISKKFRFAMDYKSAKPKYEERQTGVTLSLGYSF